MLLMTTVPLYGMKRVVEVVAEDRQDQVNVNWLAAKE
jgi:hypothetical protein